MMRALYSGITGLRNHQTRMDVIGNNISNVNTAGYKSSRVIFKDIYSQTTRSASGANGATNGGINPQQIGLGSATAAIDILFTRSAAQYTGNTLDLSIEGDGFFTVSNGGRTLYTRAGNFYTDEQNRLVNADGAYVQGFVLDAAGNVHGVDADPATDDPDYTHTQNIDLTGYKNITITTDGVIYGISTADGTTKKILGRLAIATFNNQNALVKAGQNTYSNTVNSGDAVYSPPGSGGSGALNLGSLEMSNVDLATEFSDMIVTQRGFQANSRIITTTDSMLEELVNLKR